MINEDVVPLPGARTEPVQNPEMNLDNMSNVHVLHPEPKLFHDKPQTDKFWITLYTSQGEQNMRGHWQDILELAQHYGITKFDKHNHVFYAPSNTTGTVPTMFVRGPAQQPISPVQLAQLARDIQQQGILPAMESLTWNDLLGEPTAMEVLHEVANSGREHRHDGVLVDPTTAELVLTAHRCMTPENRQRYEQKSLRQMITIAERAVQRGVIHVTLEEHDPNMDSIMRANSHSSSERDEIRFKMQQIKRQLRPARWKAEKLKPHYERLRQLDADNHD